MRIRDETLTVISFVDRCNRNGGANSFRFAFPFCFVIVIHSHESSVLFDRLQFSSTVGNRGVGGINSRNENVQKSQVIFRFLFAMFELIPVVSRAILC